MGKLRGTWQNAEDNHNRHQVQIKFNHCFAPWKEIALGIILLHHLFVKKKALLSLTMKVLTKKKIHTQKHFKKPTKQTTNIKNTSMRPQKQNNIL